MTVLTDSWCWTPTSPQPIAAYLHVPFCRHRCGYCNFSLLANRNDLFDRYLDAIEQELRWLENPRPIRTIFFGGGTPSILSPSQLTRLSKVVREWLPFQQGASVEWSIETNPLDINEEFCRTCTELGIDRISIGGQSFNPAKLQTLERDHSPAQLVNAIELAKRHFKSVSVDLIFGAPGETHSEWMADIEQTIALDIDHVSTYGLTYEKGAKFWSMREKGQLESVPEELELRMYLDAIDRLSASGFNHYEISNFSKPGLECVHNQAYWRGERWWAFGPSAARYVGDTRSVNHRGTLEYLKRVERNESPVSESETLDREQQLRERFVFGMRQTAGVPWDDWKVSEEAEACLVPNTPSHRSDSQESVIADIDKTVKRHIASGWLERNFDRIRLTRSGLVISDALWNEYL